MEDEEGNKVNQDTMISNDYLESDIYSPLNGSIVPLSKVNDPIFAEEMMGKGLAIQPESDEVRAPIAGTISMITVSKHAIGITSSDGIELLIHVGLDTVKLNGKGFELLISENEKVDVGQPILKFDANYIKEQGYDIITPVLITNSSEFEEIIVTDSQNIKVKDKMITVIKK